MKVLLVVPNLPKELDWGTTPEPPLGVASVAAYLEDDHEVRILDNYLERLPPSEVEKQIRSFSPDAVGISAMTFTFGEAQKIAARVKGIDKNINVFVGGPHASLFPAEVLKCENVDAAVRGEGEFTAKEYLDCVKSGKPLNGVAGLAFRRAGKVELNPPRPVLTDLDSLRMPARHLLKIQEYPEYKMSVLLKPPLTTMCTSRGCPYNCSYCSSPTIWGRSWRGSGGKRVVDEMQFLVEKYGVRSIKFHEDHFTLNRKRVLEICSEITSRGLDVTWQCEARVNNVDREILQAMKKAGCRIVWYGIESGTQKILDFYRKGTTLEQIKNAVSLTKEAGVSPMGSFILGAPLESREEMEETIRFGLGLGLKEVYFNALIAIPGTDLYDYVVKNNYLHKHLEGGIIEVEGKVPREEVLMFRNKAQKKVITKKILENWPHLLGYFVTHPAALASKKTLNTVRFLAK